MFVRLSGEKPTSKKMSAKMFCIVVIIVALAQSLVIPIAAKKPFNVIMKKVAKSELVEDVMTDVRDEMKLRVQGLGEDPEDDVHEFLDDPYGSAMRILEEKVQDRIDAGTDVLKCF